MSLVNVSKDLLATLANSYSVGLTANRGVQSFGLQFDLENMWPDLEAESLILNLN